MCIININSVNFIYLFMIFFYPKYMYICCYLFILWDLLRCKDCRNQIHKTHYDHNYSTISYSCLVNMNALRENENSLCLDCYNVTIKMPMTTTWELTVHLPSKRIGNMIVLLLYQHDAMITCGLLFICSSLFFFEKMKPNIICQFLFLEPLVWDNHRPSFCLYRCCKFVCSS